MEPITTGVIAGWAAECITVKVVEFLLKGANSQLKKDDVRKAINKGIQVATEKHNPLFYACPRDSWKSVKKFLNQFVEQQVEELQKPLNGEGQPDVNFLAKAFEQSGKDFFGEKGELNSELIKPWLEVFCQTYFAHTDAFLKFQVKKENYFRQLANRFDDIKFAGIAVEGQEVDKSKDLAEIFVMPDVVEEVGENSVFDLGAGERQQALLEQQRLRAASKPSGRKFLAAQLLQQTDSNKFVLLGAPGSGKTTLAKYFAVMLAQGKIEKLGLDPNQDYLPIIIPIRDLAREGNVSILEFAKNFAEKSLAVKDLPTDFFDYWLEDGRAVILLDGLDEVAETGKRYDIVSRIESFLGQFPKNLAIITSRPAGYKRDFFRTEEFPHFELQGFNDEKVEEFINRWYSSRFDDKAEAARRNKSLQRALGENARIKLLARNPLLLTIIALIHRYQGGLPKKRHELYEKAVATLIFHWDKNKEITAHKQLQYLDLDDLWLVLGKIAYWIHSSGNTEDQEGGTIIDRQELREQLKEEIAIIADLKPHKAEKETDRFLSLIQERTGLLNEQGQDCYAFVHKTFQEYLCAKAIDYEGDMEIVLDHIRTHLHDPHWREVLLLLIVQQKSKPLAEAIEAILHNGSEYEQWLHRDLFFAGSCLAENPKSLRRHNPGVVKEILTRLVALEVSDGNKVGGQVREQVFKTLRGLYETVFQQQALDLLKAEGEKIDKFRLQEYRAELGEKEEVIAILISLLRDDDSSVCSRAADALVKLGKGSEEVVTALLPLLRDDDSSVRSNAADALGAIGKGSEEVTALLSLLRDDDSFFWVRSNAADALGAIGKGSEEVVTALLSLLKDDDSFFIRSNAALALGKLGKGSEEVVTALLSLLKDDDFLVRSDAALALGKLGKGSEEVVTALLPLLKDDSSVRSNAALALGKLGKGSEEVVMALLPLLRDAHSFVRINAAAALGNFEKDSKGVFTALLPLLRDAHSSVRFRAASALGHLGKKNPSIPPKLVQWLQENEDYPELGDGINALWQIVNEAS